MVMIELQLEEFWGQRFIIFKKKALVKTGDY